MGSLNELLHCRCSGAANQPELKFPIRPSQAGAKGLFVCAPCPVGKSPIWVKFVIAKKGSGLLVAGAMRSTASNAPLRAMRHTLHREVPIATLRALLRSSAAHDSLALQARARRAIAISQLPHTLTTATALLVAQRAEPTYLLAASRPKNCSWHPC